MYKTNDLKNQFLIILMFIKNINNEKENLNNRIIEIRNKININLILSKKLIKDNNEIVNFINEMKLIICNEIKNLKTCFINIKKEENIIKKNIKEINKKYSDIGNYYNENEKEKISNEIKKINKEYENYLINLLEIKKNYKSNLLIINNLNRNKKILKIPNEINNINIIKELIIEIKELFIKIENTKINKKKLKIYNIH